MNCILRLSALLDISRVVDSGLTCSTDAQSEITIIVTQGTSNILARFAALLVWFSEQKLRAGPFVSSLYSENTPACIVVGNQ